MAGCNPDVKNNYGDTPLHTAARSGHAGVFRILISAFCNVNQVNKNGDTALHIATAMGKRKLTKILLEAGCDQSIQNKQGEIALDIANRKEFSEVAGFLSNPPPQNGKKRDKKSIKRRCKGSGTSQGSKDSSCRLKKETKKSKRGHNVHFHDEKGQSSNGFRCPYGFHKFSSLSSFPNLKLESLPSEEQYFVDLSGNINKGPVGVGYKCYCAPFFHHVEKKMESDKRELIDHIETAHDDLNTKIIHLERSTRSHLFKFSQSIKEKVASERMECMERMERRTFQERLEHNKQQWGQLSNIKAELQSWVESKRNESKHKSDQSSVTNTRIRQPIMQRWSHSVIKKNNLTNVTGLMRSKSEELLAEADEKTALNLVAGACSPESHRTTFHKTCSSHYPVPVKDRGRDVFNHLPMRTKAKSYQATGVVQRLQTDFEKLGAGPKSDSIPQHIQQRELVVFQNERNDPRDAGQINALNKKGNSDQLAYLESSYGYTCRHSPVSNLVRRPKEPTSIGGSSGALCYRQSGATHPPSSNYHHLTPTSQVEYNKQPAIQRVDFHHFQTVNNYDMNRPYKCKYIPEHYARYASSVRPVNCANRGAEMKNQIMGECLNSSSLV
ncbi:uncharacterized protein LOC111083157 [Limulus polyphemus]|uniref:Uncharacterized protein LOC111083157 n=1 Tax=Limulus polyphemus TaxID=6850 RepID=A0ABM1RUV7_LIMPO|nr:uncharacterized protein LOC111083157 [Limulus polyphemus]